MTGVTVAIPVRDGGEQLRGTLTALAAQTVEHELLVVDSGSRDGSPALARSFGARVLEISGGAFNHGTTRNLLMEQATGEHVALLTQDAEPAGRDWLERLLGAFALEGDVGLAYGPYLPRPGASPAVRLELERWFGSLAPEGMPTVERLAAGERALAPLALVGRRGFFTDANACIARAAWRRVPFRNVAYAEDRALALDMLRAGYAKVFVPAAGVFHSHEYGWLEQLRRSFDEGRGLREVYGWREPASPGYVLSQLRGEMALARHGQAFRPGAAAAGRASGPEQAEGASRTWPGAAPAGLAARRAARLIGGILGSRAGALPAWARGRLSLERRSGFAPLEHSASPPTPPV